MPRFTRSNRQVLRLKSQRRIKGKGKVEWVKAPDIDKRISHLVSSLSLDWIEKSRLYSFRSKNSKTRASARIWGLSRIWQKALDSKPAYIIEVISERFDSQDGIEKDQILLHELAHIPKNFSGSLLPHIRKRGKRNFEDRVRQLVSRNKRQKL